MNKLHYFSITTLKVRQDQSGLDFVSVVDSKVCQDFFTEFQEQNFMKMILLLWDSIQLFQPRALANDIRLLLF